MKYGISFAALATSLVAAAAGASHNAAMRGYKNAFDLAVDGGTADPLMIAQIGAGCVLDSVRIETDANLSGVTFTIGTADDPDKYGTAAAGPNATVQTRYPPLALKLDATTVKEDIILTPSAAIAGAGSIRTTVIATHR